MKKIWLGVGMVLVAAWWGAWLHETKAAPANERPATRVRMYPATSGEDPDTTPGITFGPIVGTGATIDSFIWWDTEWINIVGGLELTVCDSFFGSSTIVPGNCNTLIEINGGTIDTIDGCDTTDDEGRFLSVAQIGSGSSATLKHNTGNLWLHGNDYVLNDSNYDNSILTFNCLDTGSGAMRWVESSRALLDDSGVLVVPAITIRSSTTGVDLWLDGADGLVNRVIIGADTDGGYSTTIEQQNDIVQIYTGDTGQNPDIDDLWLTYDAGAGLLSLEKPV
ncbi:MAG: hypothetical protein GY708_08405, partial [Actinomycetia bacterium]|nr:hypothetical protein [Actinomycetes bacterium]